MAVDAVQLLGLALTLVGIWVAAPTGVALILTGLIVLAVGFALERA